MEKCPEEDIWNYKCSIGVSPDECRYYPSSCAIDFTSRGWPRRCGCDICRYRVPNNAATLKADRIHEVKLAKQTEAQEVELKPGARQTVDFSKPVKNSSGETVFKASTAPSKLMIVPAGSTPASMEFTNTGRAVLTMTTPNRWHRFWYRFFLGWKWEKPDSR